MSWKGVTAGQHVWNMLFVETKGLDVTLNTQTHEVRFNKGSATQLEEILAEKTREVADNQRASRYSRPRALLVPQPA